MPEFLSSPFSSAGFMPHGHCFLWNPGLLWLNVASDGFTALAYTSIPFTLVYLVRKRNDLAFDWMLLCFGLFILSCGVTHVMEIWTLWAPHYWLLGTIKAVTAVASVATALLLIALVPKALAIPSARQLAGAHEELRQAHELLQLRVQERTSALTESNAELTREINERKRVEEALRKSESRNRRLSDAGIIGILTIDLQGKILDVNDAFLNMVNYTREEVRLSQVRWEDLTPPEWRHLDERAIEQLKVTGIAPAWEKEYLRKDGSRVPILVGVAMLEGTAGECIAFILDLTELKRAEATVEHLRAEHEADAMFRGLLEAAPDAMVIVDREGCIVIVNAQAETLFGYSREELLGKPVELLVPMRSRAAHVGQRAKYYDHPTVRAPMGAVRDLSGRRKDGSVFPVEISLSPLETQHGLLVSSDIRDMTAQRRAAEELRRAKDVAETASHELEAFSYSVAHDLRAPLRAINGYSAALLEDVGDKLDAEAKDYLDRIGAGAGRMGQLIDALLGLSRVSRTDFVRESVDLSEIAHSVCAQLQAGDKGRSVEFVIADGLHAHGDPQLLRVLLENLLGNAWKFASKHDAARIELGQTQQGADQAYFVRDNGAGFDMKYVDKLFTPFQRLHTVSSFAGTGIGLATVQRIVNRHGGKIWAQGVVEQGATFYFTLDATQKGCA